MRGQRPAVSDLAGQDSVSLRSGCLWQDAEEGRTCTLTHGIGVQAGGTACAGGPEADAGVGSHCTTYLPAENFSCRDRLCIAPSLS